MDEQMDKSHHLRHVLLYEFNKICAVYREDSMAKHTARKWFAQFKDANFQLEDKKHIGLAAEFDEDSLNALLLGFVSNNTRTGRENHFRAEQEKKSVHLDLQKEDQMNCHRSASDEQDTILRFNEIQEHAAIKIQSLVRKFLASRYVEKLKETKNTELQCRIQKIQNQAAVKIQALVRRFLAKCEVERIRHEKPDREDEGEPFVSIRMPQDEAAIKIQCLVRRFLACRVVHRLKVAKLTKQDEEHLNAIRQQAATKIQCLIRRFLAYRHVQQMKAAFETSKQEQLVQQAHLEQAKVRAAIKIQSVVRGYLVRCEMQRLEVAAVKIQSMIRKFLASRYTTRLKLLVKSREEALRIQKVQEKSATHIQALVRGFLARCAVSKLKGVQLEEFEIINESKWNSALEQDDAFETINDDRMPTSSTDKDQDISPLLQPQSPLTVEDIQGGIGDPEILDFLSYARAKATQIVGQTQECDRQFRLLQQSLQAPRNTQQAGTIPSASGLRSIASAAWAPVSRPKVEKVRKEVDPQKAQEAAIKIQSWYRGAHHRRKMPTEQLERIQKRLLEVRHAPCQEENPQQERSEPINRRIDRHLEGIVSSSLSERRIAALRLSRLTKTSSIVADYVLRRNGLASILDALENMNRSEAHLLVIRPLSSLILTLLRNSTVVHSYAKEYLGDLVKNSIKQINNNHKDEEVVKENAYILDALKTYKGFQQALKEAKYEWYLEQLAKTFRRLPTTDARFVVLEEVLDKLIHK